MQPLAERHNLVVELIAELNRSGFLAPGIVWQAAVFVLALGLAWLSNHYFKPRLGLDHARWKFGGEGFSRVYFPLSALVLVLIGGITLRTVQPLPHHLLAIAMVLLTAMVNIRVLVYMLKHAFSQAQWVQRWEKYIAGVIWTIYALHVLGILPEVAELLDSISFHLGKSRISVLNILQGLVSVAGTMLVAIWLGRLFETRMMAAKMMDMSVRVVLVKVVQTLLVVFAVMIALPLVGIDLTVLSLFGGALGVGLGFGLQKIASNYVSGFIILIDRSIKIGDLVTIDNRQGVISGITARYVVLKSADGTESLIPNDTLVTSTVVNQSYNDRAVWVKLPVSVAYESDLELVMKLLEATTAGHPRIAPDPAPRAFVEAFAESAVNMSLGFWVRDPENGTLGLRSEINCKIWQAFRENGISIPFNRLDIVHFKPSSRLAGEGNLQGIE
ncbi:Mechanosensitive channel MscK [Andreprevotia sp. IGB-42]|uniref:mechanosensitive ion channel family protein n=1 Tax=Andreprevotia sp. IGB-42 TaxID=2497473 RepID=UPI00135C6218|nr:mechanosensitive ion channel domain-containing protein [Andreprevotia sp. IGB-42]KAF0811248.1 Mechanosensitive channel MscK [Andreprevotia sp. IGB-42]